ncbi:MAG: helix-turn-helix domain-containing protein [Acidobacteriota bacterium]|nr:helix-turn-helix domain-containing protein [Acidobacteriota bacterium]
MFLYNYLERNIKNPYKKRLPTVEELKRSYISYVLEVNKNNICEAAKILGISKKRLEKLIEKYRFYH